MGQEIEKLKQWDLPQKKGIKVQISEKVEAEFIYMDGMYAQWLVDGKIQIGNYETIYRLGDKYAISEALLIYVK